MKHKHSLAFTSCLSPTLQTNVFMVDSSSGTVWGGGEKCLQRGLQAVEGESPASDYFKQLRMLLQDR